MATTDPRSATQGQWEDLANRIQSKAEIGSVVSPPSNVAYVTTNNIVNKAVTANKIADSVLKYLPGDTLEVGNPLAGSGQANFVISAAYVTSGAKEIGFNIPIAKSANGLTATFTSGTFWVRTADSNQEYLIRGDSITSYNTLLYPFEGFLGVQIKKSDDTAFNVSNNTVLVVGGYFTIAFS